MGALLLILAPLHASCSRLPSAHQSTTLPTSSSKLKKDADKRRQEAKLKLQKEKRARAAAKVAVRAGPRASLVIAALLPTLPQSSSVARAQGGYRPRCVP